MLNLLKQHFQPALPSLLLALLGLAAALTAFSYDIGSFTRMGPGFFPLALGIILMLLSILTLFHERLVSREVPTIAWRPILAVSFGILIWAVMAETLGFFIASICQIILCSLALTNVRWRSMLVLAVLLSTGGYLLFVMQLGVPLSAIGS